MTSFPHFLPKNASGMMFRGNNTIMRAVYEDGTWVFREFANDALALGLPKER
jgi:hypothetical protein